MALAEARRLVIDVVLKGGEISKAQKGGAGQAKGSRGFGGVVEGDDDS